jgi:hypothetical protein
MSALDLRRLVPVETGASQFLETFIGERLFAVGVWESPRTCDGIEHLRVIEHQAVAVRVCGRLYAIDQTVHSFWLELLGGSSDQTVEWVLWFGLIASSPRQERNAIDLAHRAEDLEWRVAVSATCAARNGVLIAVPSDRPTTAAASGSDAVTKGVGHAARTPKSR